MDMLEKFIKVNTGYDVLRVVHERASISDILDKVGTLSKIIDSKGFYCFGYKRSSDLPIYLNREDYIGKSMDQISLETGIETVFNAGYEVYEKRL